MAWSVRKEGYAVAAATRWASTTEVGIWARMQTDEAEGEEQ